MHITLKHCHICGHGHELASVVQLLSSKWPIEVLSMEILASKHCCQSTVNDVPQQRSPRLSLLVFIILDSHCQIQNYCNLPWLYHSTGDIFIPFLKKEALFLKVKSGKNLVTIPVVTRTEFALTPLSEEHNKTDAAIRSWEGEFQSITELFEAKVPMPTVSVQSTLH